jgi:hypothetical protein
MSNPLLYLRFGVLLAVLAVATACASNPELDPRRLQQAQTAIQEAREVNAGRHAAGTIARAEERLTMAREAVDDGDEKRARYLLEESAVLAELAEAQALERDSELALAQIRNSLAVLEQRLN